MMNLKARLERLERRMITAMSAEQGLTYEEFLEEAEAFFSLPLAEQLAQVGDIDAELRRQGMSMDDIADIKATLIRKYRPRGPHVVEVTP
jgi:hypothetical protein